MGQAMDLLFDFLVAQSWQIALVVAMVAAMCLALRKSSAHWRYLLWLIVVAKCFVLAQVPIPLALLSGARPRR